MKVLSFVSLLNLILFSPSSINGQAWHTHTLLPNPATSIIAPKPLNPPELIIYATSLAQCGSQPIANSACASRTGSGNLVLSQSVCSQLTSFPSIPNSNAPTNLYYQFDSLWNLAIFTDSVCSRFLGSFTNPQWGLSNGCSNYNGTQWQQFGWQSGQYPTWNGTMIIDPSGQGYGNCPNGYFWPGQPNNCLAPFDMGLLGVIAPPVSPPTKNFMATCPNNNNNLTNSYSMSLTIGLKNPCPANCDGTNLRVIFSAVSACIRTAKDNAGVCTCYNTGIQLVAPLNTCNDPYVNYQLNQFYNLATAPCAAASMVLSIDAVPPAPCTDCGPAVASAVIFALLFACFVIFYIYKRYQEKALAPLNEMRSEARAH